MPAVSRRERQVSADQDLSRSVADYSNYVKEMHAAGRSVDEAMKGLAARLARYEPCASTLTAAAELQTIDCRFRTDQAARNAFIMYDELEGRVSTYGSAKKRP